MYSFSTLPKNIPIFPLSGALLLPKAKLPLNIFEPRYLQMIDDCLRSEHRLIGMIQTKETPHDAPKTKLEAIGCAGRLTSYSETEDQRYFITLSGVSRFKISQETDGFSPYRNADVDWAGFENDLNETQKDVTFDRPKFLKLLDRFFQDQGLSTDWDTLNDANEETMVNSLSMLCPFSNEEKQILLECPCLTTRRETLSALMEFALRDKGEEKGIIQ